MQRSETSRRCLQIQFLVFLFEFWWSAPSLHIWKVLITKTYLGNFFFKELALESYLCELLEFTIFKRACKLVPRTLLKTKCIWQNSHFFANQPTFFFLAENGLINIFVKVSHCIMVNENRFPTFIWPFFFPGALYEKIKSHHILTLEFQVFAMFQSYLGNIKTKRSTIYTYIYIALM